MPAESLSITIMHTLGVYVCRKVLYVFCNKQLVWEYGYLVATLQGIQECCVFAFLYIPKSLAIFKEYFVG